MANEVETLVATAVIKSSADKFYNFFKYDIIDVVKIYPALFTGAQVVEGVVGSVGCVLLFNYVLGGIPLTVKAKTEAIDDAEKSIKLVAIEGDVLQLYKSFGATFYASEGLAKWNIEYEKATLITPPPELYAAAVTTLCTLVDAYLLIN